MSIGCFHKLINFVCQTETRQCPLPGRLSRREDQTRAGSAPWNSLSWNSAGSGQGMAGDTAPPGGAPLSPCGFCNKTQGTPAAPQSWAAPGPAHGEPAEKQASSCEARVYRSLIQRLKTGKLILVALVLKCIYPSHRSK